MFAFQLFSHTHTHTHTHRQWQSSQAGVGRKRRSEEPFHQNEKEMSMKWCRIWKVKCFSQKTNTDEYHSAAEKKCRGRSHLHSRRQAKERENPEPRIWVYHSWMATMEFIFKQQQQQNKRRVSEKIGVSVDFIMAQMNGNLVHLQNSHISVCVCVCLGLDSVLLCVAETAFMENNMKKKFVECSFGIELYICILLINAFASWCWVGLVTVRWTYTDCVRPVRAIRLVFIWYLHSNDFKLDHFKCWSACWSEFVAH